MTFYRALLWLYPASFRAEYGDEMRAVFARRWRQGDGFASRLALCLESLGDALRNAPAIHRDILRQDTVQAFRAIRRASWLSLTVVLVTAIGIGATTAAFSLADHVLIRPLPFREPERLVKVFQQTPRGMLEPSPAHFRDWRDNAASFEAIAAYAPNSGNLVGAGDPLRLEGFLVSGNLFAVLGVPPLVGRTLVADDDREGAPSTIVISERLWRSRFAGDHAVVGRTLILNDSPRVIVGVMPRTFEFPTRLGDFWIPFQFRPDAFVYGNPYLHTIGRLNSGVSREQALAEVQQISRAAASGEPTADPNVGVTVIPVRDELSRQSRLLLVWLLAAAAALLLIACTNLANLLLTRGLSRRKELAIRAALGAGRHRLIRQMLTESLWLAAAGGMAGVALAAAAMPTVARLVPTTLPIAEAPALDIRLLLTAVAVTMACAVGFGLIPALRTARHADATALHEGARAGTGRMTERLRSLLVVAQVGASIVLLVSSGLLLRAMLEIQRVDPGFETSGVLTLRTTLPLPKYGSVAFRHRFYERVLGEVRGLPGVSRVSYVTGLPMVMRGQIWAVAVPGFEHLPPLQRLASSRFVTPGFFATLGIPLLAGRDVAESDTQTSEPVVIVSQSFVNKYWPGQEAIGRRFPLMGQDHRVVGVVGDIRVRGLERPSEPQMYLSSRQVADGALSGYVPRDLVVKSSVPPLSLVPAIRAIIANAEPQQPISDVQLLADIVSGETASRRVQVRVLGAFAAIAFLLAGIGLHGLLSYNVSQGAREIGVRMALGAERRTILAMVLRRGLGLALIGVVLGAALAIAAGRTLQALLAGISPTDVVTFGAAIALAILMTILGSLLPALRAVRVNPLEVMRSE